MQAKSLGILSSQYINMYVDPSLNYVAYTHKCSHFTDMCACIQIHVTSNNNCNILTRAILLKWEEEHFLHS